MKGKRIVLSIAVMAMTVAGGATANEIYKWTDEDGNVYYGDRPSGASTEERLGITYQPTDNSVVEKRVQSRLDAQTARHEAESVAAAKKAEADENAAAEQARKERCDRARARLNTYVQGQDRRLYRTDENGERVYLDDAERAQARTDAEKQVTEFCS